MTEPQIGVVIPAGPGRLENLERVIECLRLQVPQRPVHVVVVADGPDAVPEDHPLPGVTCVRTQVKHAPGMEQPRNIGVRFLSEICTHVWFLDTDLVVEPDCLEAMASAIAQADERRIVVGPYDWLPRGMVPEAGWISSGQIHRLHNDPRWEMIRSSPPNVVYENDLSAGLGCFSGNLVWNIAEFKRVGGFWSEIHHGRCEDGELGVRAVAMGVGISFNALARGWHVAHPVNGAAIVQANKRDVPMLNERHPWIQSAGIELNLDRDGAAFDVDCPGCGQRIPTIRWWDHAAECEVSPHLEVEVT